MIYNGAKELVENFRMVHKNTILIAEEIPEDLKAAGLKPLMGEFSLKVDDQRK